MPRPNYWPAGPNYYLANQQRPPLSLSPPALFPYENWGSIHATTIWNDAGRCSPGAGVAPPGFSRGNAGQGWDCQGVCYGVPFGDAGAGDDSYFAELIAERTTPNSAKPYLERGQWPPVPGSAEYLEHIRPQFRYGRIQEEHWIDWWYSHFTSDAPRYELPPVPTASEPPATGPGPRPPRDWPEQTPATPTGPTFTPTAEPPGPVTTTSEPPTQEARPVPWGWVVGGSAVALLIGGGVAYAMTRPKKRRKKG